MCLLALEQLVVNRAKYRRVAYGSIVDGKSVDACDGEEQSLGLNLFDHLAVRLLHIGRLGVVVEDLSVVTVTAFELGADDGRDLLRRPRGASSTGEAFGGGGDVEHLDDDGIRHEAS